MRIRAAFWETGGKHSGLSRGQTVGGMKPAKKQERPVLVHDRSKLNGQLRELGGSLSDDWNNVLGNQVVRTVWVKHSDPEYRQEQYRAVIAAMAGLRRVTSLRRCWPSKYSSVSRAMCATNDPAKAAKALGLTIPQNLQIAADEVIE
jgi:hypothetical protein